MDSPNMLGTCLFFSKEQAERHHEIKDLINSFYIICIKIFGCLSKNPYPKDHKKKKKHPRLQEIHQPITFDS